VGVDGAVLRDRLFTEHSVLVRECGNKVGSSSRFLRLVVRPPHEVRQLVSALERVLYGGPAQPAPVAAPVLPPLAAAAPGAGAPHGLQLVPASVPVMAPPQLAAQARAQAPASMPVPLPAQVPGQPLVPAPLTAGTSPAAVPVVGPMAMARGYTSSGTAAVDRLVSG
jgi:hypothetical protein